MSNKRHYHLFTVSNQGLHTEVVFRIDEMNIKLQHLQEVKSNGANFLGVPDSMVRITNHIYLGFMDEEEFSPAPPSEAEVVN